MISNLPYAHEEGDSDQAHVGRGRVQPPCVGPRLRCELHQRPLELASDRRLVLHRLPLVLAHGEELAHLHPGEDAKPVAHQHVEHQVVPPALVEVGQQVAKDHLGQLPHDGDGPADSIVSDDQGLHAPAPVVAEGEPVKVGVELAWRDVPAICPILFFAVDCVVFHFWVEPDDHTSDGLVVLVDEELEEEEIHDRGTKDASPKGRMRPGERSIGEGEDGDDEEEDRDPDQPAVDVAVNVSCLVPGDRFFLSQDHS